MVSLLRSLCHPRTVLVVLSLSRRSYLPLPVQCPLVFCISRSSFRGPWSSLPTSTATFAFCLALSSPTLGYSICPVVCLSVCPRVPPAPTVYVCMYVCIFSSLRICRFVVTQAIYVQVHLSSIAASITLQFRDGTSVYDERAKRKKEKKRIVFCFFIQ